MIIRKNLSDKEWQTDEPSRHGHFHLEKLSEMGGLGHFAAVVDHLQAKSRSSNLHWHENEDEFLYMLTGEATVIEESGEQIIYPGDAVCWPAGEKNGHSVYNHTDFPCSYLICGTKVENDIVHYPELGRTLYIEGKNWRILNNEDGNLYKEGVEP